MSTNNPSQKSVVLESSAKASLDNYINITNILVDLARTFCPWSAEGPLVSEGDLCSAGHALFGSRFKNHRLRIIRLKCISQINQCQCMFMAAYGVSPDQISANNPNQKSGVLEYSVETLPRLPVRQPFGSQDIQDSRTTSTGYLFTALGLIKSKQCFSLTPFTPRATFLAKSTNLLDTFIVVQSSPSWLKRVPTTLVWSPWFLVWQKIQEPLTRGANLSGVLLLALTALKSEQVSTRVRGCWMFCQTKPGLKNIGSVEAHTSQHFGLKLDKTIMEINEFSINWQLVILVDQILKSIFVLNE